MIKSKFLKLQGEKTPCNFDSVFRELRNSEILDQKCLLPLNSIC